MKPRVNFKRGSIINTIKRDLISNIGRILQVIQGSYYIISTEEELFVKTLYELNIQRNYHHYYQLPNM